MAERTRSEKQQSQRANSKQCSAFQRNCECGRNLGPGGKCAVCKSSIRHSSRGGKALPDRERADLESRFGHDFADVCIHTGRQAEQRAAEVGARAFTVGNGIFFGRDQYQPRAQDGKQLLSHELTHVIQQQRGITGSARVLEQQAVSRENAPRQLAGEQGVPRIRMQMAPVEITSFVADKPNHTVLITFNDGTQIKARLEQVDLTSGTYATRYSKDEKKLIFEEVEDTGEDVIYFSMTIDSEADLSKYEKALKQLDSPVPFKVIGHDFSDLESPFGTGKKPAEEEKSEEGNKSNGEKQGSFNIELITAGEFTELPDWIPQPYRSHLLDLNFEPLKGHRVLKGVKPELGDGLYIIERSPNPWGDVYVYIKHPGGGFIQLEFFQQYPEDRDFYERFTENDRQTEIFYRTFTRYNSDLHYYVVKKGYSIMQAREQMRKDASKELKLVFQAAAAILGSGWSTGGVTGGAAQPSEALKQLEKTIDLEKTRQSTKL